MVDMRFSVGTWLQQHEEAVAGTILPGVAVFQRVVIKGTAEDHELFECKRPSSLIASCVALGAWWFLRDCSLELLEEAFSGIGWRWHYRSELMWRWKKAMSIVACVEYLFVLCDSIIICHSFFCNSVIL